MIKRLSVATLCLILSSVAQADVAYSGHHATCMEEAGGVTMKMIECIGAEYEAQDARLNGAYQALRNGLPTERRQSLLEAQRLWIDYRDANCRFYATAGGTLARVAANQCMLRETAERADELEAGRRF